MDAIKKFLPVAAIACLSWEAVAGENLLTCETDFETTAEGWYGWNPDVPVPARVQDGAIGDWALEVRGSDAVRTPFIWDALRPDTDYTVSFDAKGDGGALAICLVTVDWKWLGRRSFELNPKWRRLSYTFRTGKKGDFGRAFCLEVKHSGTGEWLRLDGIKIEEGTAPTPYDPCAVQFSAALEEPGEIHFTSDGLPAMKVRAAGVKVPGSHESLVAEVVNESGDVMAVKPLASGQASLVMPGAADSGYYPWKTRLRTSGGTVLASRETPFVVTRRFGGNEFFGVQICAGVPIDALRRVGFRWTRANTKFWRWDEQDGPRPFSGKADEVEPGCPDRLHRLATAWGHNAPKWALGPGRTMWTDDVNNATNYLANLVHATTNTVDQYEVINEPDLVLPREKGVSLYEACDYLAQAVELTSKYVRPTGKPVVVDVSGTREGNVFVEHVLSRVPSSVDMIAAHPYSWPRELSEDGRVVSDPETGGFINDLEVKTALLGKYGKSRMSIGELGWALDMAAPYASASAEKFGWYLARMHLLARTYPSIEYLIWYALANAPENGTLDYGIWRSNPADGTRPLPAVAAACEAARRIPAPGEGNVALLEKDGIYLLSWKDADVVNYAYWTDEPIAEPLGMLDAPPRSAFGYDGRRLDVSKLTLSGEPVYLEVKPAQAAAFEASFRSSAARAYARRPPLSREDVRVRRFAGDWKTYDFAADAASFTLGGKRTDVQPPDPTVQWSGAGDLSGRFLLGWDDESFYYFAAVRDDTHCVPKKDYECYMNDVIQLAFDPKDNAKKNAGYLSDDCEFGLCEGQPPFAWVRPGMSNAAYIDGDFSSVVRKGDTTEYRAAIPWKLMGLERAPKSFGFAFAVCDNDDNARARYWLAFGNGIADGKRPARFKRALLVNDKEAK